MSDTGYENIKYELTRGYINKPSSPFSAQSKSQPPMAKVVNMKKKNNNEIIGAAGAMTMTVNETKRDGIVKNGIVKNGDMSPIPHYKHLQILTDHDKVDVVNTNDGNDIVTVKGGGIIKP